MSPPLMQFFDYFYFTASVLHFHLLSRFFGVLFGFNHALLALLEKCVFQNTLIDFLKIISHTHILNQPKKIPMPFSSPNPKSWAFFSTGSLLGHTYTRGQSQHDQTDFLWQLSLCLFVGSRTYYYEHLFFFLSSRGYLNFLNM